MILSNSERQSIGQEIQSLWNNVIVCNSTGEVMFGNSNFRLQVDIPCGGNNSFFACRVGCTAFGGGSPLPNLNVFQTQTVCLQIGQATLHPTVCCRMCSKQLFGGVYYSRYINGGCCTRGREFMFCYNTDTFSNGHDFVFKYINMAVYKCEVVFVIYISVFLHTTKDVITFV